MAKLTEAQKRFIVEKLACYHPPTEVARMVLEEFGVEVSRQQVHYYDPTKYNGNTRVSEMRVAHFRAARNAFINDYESHGVAQETKRLQVLDTLLNRELAKPHANPKLILEILEQAAKERGGAFTNHRVLDHKGEVKTSGVLLVPVAESEDDWERRARDGQSKNGGRVGAHVDGKTSGNGAGG